MYLVKIKNSIKPSYVDEIRRRGGTINYTSKLMPLIFIKHDDIKCLQNLSFIDKISSDIYGTLESYNVNVRPTIDFSIINRFYDYNDVKLAIIDSGINLDSNINIVDSINYTNKTINSTTHGTIVSTIVNQITPNIKVLSAKITDDLKIKLTDTIKAIEWAYLKGANVINLSLGFANVDCIGKCHICELVETLAKKNVVVVSAAGNGGPFEGTIECPGTSPASITVGAVNLNGNICTLSSRGRDDQLKPDLVTSGYVSVNGNLEHGTSFATPIITGIAAGIYNRYKNVEEIKEIIMNSTLTIGEEYNVQGKGVFSIEKLLGVLSNGEVVNKN